MFSMIIVRVGLGITSLSGQTKELYSTSSRLDIAPPHRRGGANGGVGPWTDTQDDDRGGALFSRIRFGPVRVPGDLTTSSGGVGIGNNTGTGIEMDVSPGADPTIAKKPRGEEDYDDFGDEGRTLEVKKAQDEEGGNPESEVPVLPIAATHVST